MDTWQEKYKKELSLYSVPYLIQLYVVVSIVFPFLANFSLLNNFQWAHYFTMIRAYLVIGAVTFLVLTSLFAFFKNKLGRWPIGTITAFSSATVSIVVDLLIKERFLQAMEVGNPLLLITIFLPYSLAFSAILSYYRSEKTNQQERIAQAIKDERRQRDLAEMQLRLLQAQIEPHFLFNTLAHLDVLIEDEPIEASRILRKLITYLRAATPNVKKTLVSVKDEVKLVNSFLGIQQSRFENRMSYHIDVEEHCNNIKIPSFTILTLAENAVKHAIEPSALGGSILLSVKQVNSRLIITMTNSSNDSEEVSISRYSHEYSSGTGLKNIKERLQSLYEDNASFHLEHPVKNTTQAIINIPITE